MTFVLSWNCLDWRMCQVWDRCDVCLLCVLNFEVVVFFVVCWQPGMGCILIRVVSFGEVGFVFWIDSAIS